MRLLSGTAAAVAAVIATCGLLTAPADAAMFTSTGVRCTKVGTIGPDVLRGTQGRDVICGRGGDDTIRARGGDDLVDAGGGSDKASGGYGADRVLGGPGADKLSGTTGRDQLYGGPGGDTLLGGGSADLLEGGDGDDDMVGGPGADDVRGGPGTNWCTIDTADVRTGCVPDQEPAVFGSAHLSDDVVDVTSSNHQIVVRIRVTDDTGVDSVDAALYRADGAASIRLSVSGARRVSGTVRDGVWEINGVVRRYSAPGTFHVEADATDRAGHQSHGVITAPTLAVRDRNPDTQPPEVVTLLRPTPDATFDVRNAAQHVVIKAHITDDLSGVFGVTLCPLKPLNGGYTNEQCPLAHRVSGTSRDGVWRADATIAHDSVGGDWNIWAVVNDRARQSYQVQYLGPDAYRSRTNGGANPDPHVLAFPGGRGRFGVVGITDSTPPAVEDVIITPDSVDTSRDDASVRIRVHATDAPDEGVRGVRAALAGNPDGSTDGPDPPRMPIDLALVEGTNVDGFWEGTFVLPQFTPPGTYYVSVRVEDAGHSRGYVPEPLDSSTQPLPGDSTVTVVQPAG